MSKRKLKEEKFSKRQRLSKEENLRCDSDDEQLMCAAADEIERQIHCGCRLLIFVPTLPCVLFLEI